LQGTFVLLQGDGLVASLTPLEALAAVVAAAVHDVDHRGALSTGFDRVLTGFGLTDAC
jgi:hypothetical protein